MPQVWRFVPRSLLLARDTPWTHVADGSSLFLVSSRRGRLASFKDSGSKSIVPPTMRRGLLLLGRGAADPGY